MSKIRIGHRPEDWLDQGPSEPLAPKRISGALVQGASSVRKSPSWTPEAKRAAYARTKAYRQRQRDAA